MGLAGKVRPRPELLVGFDTGDDGGVYRLGDGLALVQTVDLITPIVDDPFDFGRIAAANSLSDVYAMGGRPVTCLNICCFPKEGLSKETLRAILEGAIVVAEEAGAAMLGGHTVNDPELKFGLSVTGLVDPERILRNSRAVPGQALVLTKPLGLGVVMNAARRDLGDPALVERAIRVMTTLNAVGAQAALRRGATAATDVTGFGLAGHAYGMAVASGVAVRLRLGAVPILAGALDLHRSGIAVSQCTSNRDGIGEGFRVESRADAALVEMLHDPQTSGGLLIALPAEAAEDLVSELRAGPYPDAALIGEVLASERPLLSIVD